MDRKWLLRVVGLTMAIAIAGGIGLGVVLSSDDDDDDEALACADLDASSLGSLVVVTAPTAGGRVGSRFELRGCAATFEQNVNYRVTDRAGDVLAEGFTMTDAPDLGVTGEFRTTVELRQLDPGLISLEVFEQDVSEGEGNPPPRHVIPLVAGAPRPIAGEGAQAGPPGPPRPSAAARPVRRVREERPARVGGGQRAQAWPTSDRVELRGLRESRAFGPSGVPG